ncbi:MAG: ThiF family adenylyltransferase [Candidatus Sumerlaeota bacterium]|nr:ThiF family adenylyltransferase [Candidatus Sumerlaeota bacterium]
MSQEPQVLSLKDLDAESEDRFHRLKLIRWWDQDRLLNARALVIGAGALGNEIIKNLALLGVGRIFIVDLDTVENSNLSRSILFRESDCGRPKAQVAAEYARGIFPGIKVQWFRGNVVYDLGLGVFHWADVVLGGLDNREARLAINRACHKVGKPFIDGAIEELDGVARFFAPDGPCYECTMSKRDWELLEMRRSCALLTRSQMLEGKTPTTPTVSSIIAGVQVQEAIKHLHGHAVMAGKGLHFYGMTGESHLVEYTRKEGCYSHDRFERILPLKSSVRQATGRRVLEAVRQRLGPDTSIEFNTDILAGLICRTCKTDRAVYRSLGSVTEKEGRCPTCGRTCELVTVSSLYGDEPFLDMPLGSIGIPPFDILTARNGETRLHLLFAGDAEAVLGTTYSKEDALHG